MVTAIFALGPNAEFGNMNQLPWGSFPQELEAYKSALDEALQPHHPNIILVGKNTWDGLPVSAKQNLVNHTSNIWIYGSKMPKEYPGANFRLIRDIGFNLPEEWEYSNVVCIGGAHLLEKMFFLGHIEKAYVSTVSWETPLTYTKKNLYSGEPSVMVKHPQFECTASIPGVKAKLKGNTRVYRTSGIKEIPYSKNSIVFIQEIYYL